MKKNFTLILIALFAIIGLKAQAAMYLVGDAFNGWNTSGNVVMSTDDNNIYYYTADLAAGKYFAFFKDTEGWNYQRGPSAGNNSAPSGDWESTTSGGSWRVATSGTYLIQYNYSTDQAKIAIVEEEEFDATQRKFAVTGSAFGGWNMPPNESQTFTNNGDGTYTLVYEGASAGEFKLAGVSINDTFDSGWSVFNGGCLYNGSLAQGDNAMTSGSTSNMSFPVSGNVTLTISNVTESSCTLNITLTEEIVPDKAYYLIGTFNGWSESTMVPFVENDGVFSLTQTFSGEFKIKDENGNWLGGGVTLTSENPSVTLAPGDNLYLSDELEYTLTIVDGVLTVTGFPPAPELTGVSLRGSYDQDWANIIVLDLQNVNGAWVLSEQDIDAGFEFKVVATYDNGSQAWYGAQADGDYWVTAGVLGTAIGIGAADGYNNLYFNEAGTFTFTVGGDLATLTVTGEFDPKVLAGVVKDPIDRPIAGVKVTAIPFGGSVDGVMLREESEYTTTTADDGTFSLEVPGGVNYQVDFELYGYMPQTLGEDEIDNVILEWDPSTGISTLMAGDNVISVKYVSTTGMISDIPFKGVNIMVVTYQDGSRKAVKIVK